jgi:hypothetical protein
MVGQADRRVGERIRVAVLKRAVGVGVLVALECGSPVAPIRSPLVYQLEVLHCNTACSTTTAPADTVRAGDTLQVVLSLTDTVAGDSALVSLREPCAVNVSVLSGRTVEATVPTAPTCADSGYGRVIRGAPGGGEVRRFAWVVDVGLAPGTVVLQGEMVLDPPLTARAPLVLQ